MLITSFNPKAPVRERKLKKKIEEKRSKGPGYQVPNHWEACIKIKYLQEFDS